MNPLHQIACAVAFTVGTFFADNVLLTVSCDVGTTVTITHADGTVESWDDRNDDGKVEFSIPQDTIVTVEKWSDGSLIRYTTGGDS